MRIAEWAKLATAHPELAGSLSTPTQPTSWTSIAAEARPFLLAPMLQAEKRKALLIAASYERALQWQARLENLGMAASRIRQLPSGLSALFEDAQPEHEAISERIGALKFLTEPGPGVVIASPQSALERTLPREVLESAFLELRPGEDVDPVELVKTLGALGYERSEPVRIPGQYSRRGGIVDIFAVGRSRPVRLELFGDEIESLREFDPNTQRSTGEVSLLSLSPSRETLFLAEEDAAEARIQFAEMLLRTMEMEAAELSEEAGAQLREAVEADAAALRSGVFFDRLDLYRPLLHPDSGCAIDLMPEDGLLVLDEPSELEAISARADEELAEALLHRSQRGEILQSSAHDYLLSIDHSATRERLLSLIAFGESPRWMEKPKQIEIGANSMEPYRGQATHLTRTLQNWTEQGFTILVGTDQPTRAKAVLNQVELYATEEAQDSLQPGLFLAAGNLAGGFAMPGPKLALVTDQELFGVGRLKLPQKRFNEGVPVATVLDLKPGDYVVHINFGIGIFRGLVTREMEGVEKEYLYIEYKAPDKLYVPADQLDRIQKYLNPGDDEPKLNRLTGGEWRRTVGKAREEAREFARDLIKLYAQRKEVKRNAFGPDGILQAEMEATFPWVETASQMQAILDTKRDLQLEYPMDRLVCGDVGFGKTEVAIRAAFKVAQEGRQVAVLCPTTILSEQHHRNFVERIGFFNVNIEFLNRFRTASDRRKVLDGIESGEIDIVIGTHALLSKDLKFKDLGLVVIDEEQKFGVKQKEALKALRVHVDVLSMSATPIPRTLSMALMDIRQMSLINDPPPGRLPIRTFVKPFSPEVVREAILRELARGGQVYYVFNRVQGIYHIAERLKKMLPMARIGVGHGQMGEKELEPVMLSFIHGEIDILLSTTIIENGLDIPNANTLIVENADKLGLSQLYQLRGRVGRSDRQAYAYLLYQNNKELGENALARLQSLQEFSALGSGYSLAFRDLQIRGAGELLGAKQHGTMATVGYELYSQLIQEEVQFLKAHADGRGDDRDYNDPLEGLAPLPVIDLPVQALIPDRYIQQQAQRLYFYKQMMSARSLDELDEVVAEMTDRYGPAPEEVQRAFAIMRLRIGARDLSIEKIEGKGGRLAVVFRDDAEIPGRVVSLLTKKAREAYLSQGKLIWPYSGDALHACTRMQELFTQSWSEYEDQKAALGV